MSRPRSPTAYELANSRHENRPSLERGHSSPTKRAVPPSSKTIQQNAFKISSPPRTPPTQTHRSNARFRAPQSALAIRPPMRETFLEDITPTESNVRGHDAEERDPHDLSFSPKHVTRASVVDNMLLSLDQFDSFDQFAAASSSAFNGPTLPTAYEHDDPYASSIRYTPPLTKSRNRGHTFSSSVSSDNDWRQTASRAEDPPTRLSNQGTRGRRSNSNSNFQSGLQRIESVRAEEELTARGKVYEAQRAAAPSEGPQRVQTRSGRKNSKSSGSSSVDLSQMIAGSRIGAAGGDRRSVSFDYGQRRRTPSLEAATVFANAMFDSDDRGSDAAPTPTIPSGPRRPDSPSNFTASQSAAQSSAVRKNSLKSSRNQYLQKNRSDTLGTTSIKGRRDDFSDLRDLRDELLDMPPVPSFVNVSAPSPPVTQRKASVGVSVHTTPTNKERPGFFRRVFGSSRNPTSNTSDTLTSQSSYNELPRSRSSDQQDMQTPLSHAKLQKQGPKDMPNPAPPTAPAPVPRETPPVITKKPSSFFRRRKKSTSENMPVPPPISFHHNLKPDGRASNLEHSPVSSLRKLMDPYLAAPLASPPNHETSEQRIRTSDEIQVVRLSNDESTNARTRTLPGRTEKTTRGSVTQNPKSNTKLQIPTSDYNDDSFLADSSGNEGSSRSSQKASGSKTSSKFDSATKKRPKTSPTAPTQPESAPFDTVHKRQESAGRGVFTSRGVRNEKLQGLALIDNKNQVFTTTQSTVSPVLASRNIDSLASSDRSPKPGRGWLEAASSDEQLNLSSKLSLPLEGTKDSPISEISNYQSAHSTPQLPNQELALKKMKPPAIRVAVAQQDIVRNEPTSAHRERAEMIFEDRDEHLDKSQAAAWLGESEPERASVRKAYMELYDWSDINILASLRRLCAKILLKGETQQVDRILEAFSNRWCECNANHGFKASGKIPQYPAAMRLVADHPTDVVHTICYSLLLLNTDLHMADIDQKMTRSQFIRNTMPTIRRVVSDAAPNAFENVRGGTWPKSLATGEPTSPDAISPTSPSEAVEGKTSLELESRKHSIRPTDKLAALDSTGTIADADNVFNESGPLVSTAFTGSIKAWESQLETVLKDFYNSIQRESLPLYGAPARVQELPTPSNNLLGLTNTMLRRTPSTLSKANSETLRGRASETRFNTGRWTSKTRSRPRLPMYGGSNVGSSRTSFDDQSSVWSPSVSSTWSKHSLGKTLTSMSVDSLGSDYPRGDYQQSIGFANALSQAIIREDATGLANVEEGMRAAPLLEDEQLELAGAPWAKEGMLKHKHHLDGVDKRSKDRNWNECFAVIEKGWMRLFSFDVKAKTLRQKAKDRQKTGGVVGGGNWMDNAEEVWKFLLRQTIASALPPPGYSKARPYVWALSLPTGAVHLFNVGTPEIVKEFVTTANYWSARLSKEPLFGGVSNMEYGWGDSVINRALIHSDSMPVIQGGSRPSIQSSLRSSTDQSAPVRPKLPGDKININDWTPPQQSMMASALMEVDQLKALQTYVKNVEDELQKHNELRSAMSLAFSSRHPNSQKAMSNWERKSSYLLREIVKFRTYIDCLQAAQIQKDKFYASRASVVEEGKQSDAEVTVEDTRIIA